MRAIRLEYIQLYPTLRCNRSCSFCFNRGLGQADDMTLGSYLKILRKLKRHGVRYVDIMGGEPLLNSSIFDIVHATAKAGLGVNISTNGSMKEEVIEFCHRFRGSVNLGISINSQTELDTLADLIRLQRPVTKSLYRKTDIHTLTKNILSLSPERHYIIYPDTLKVVPPEYRVTFFEFYRTWQHVFSPASIEPVFCGGFLPDKKSASLRCPAGTVKIGVLPDGSAYPCNLFFGIKDFYLGNIFTDSIDKIISNPVLDFFRNYTSSPCKNIDCFLYNNCHGGCPVHSLLYYGSLSAPDPRCNIYIKK